MYGLMQQSQVQIIRQPRVQLSGPKHFGTRQAPAQVVHEPEEIALGAERLMLLWGPWRPHQDHEARDRVIRTLATASPILSSTIVEAHREEAPEQMAYKCSG